ncbi:MAG: hypothetical protein MUE60_13135, partial [Candidatus Eisenbacteria bacterium]|nr:hypothetical protein [Candidatus Eisenbacteria bacterium]
MTRPERPSVGEVRKFWERQAGQLHEFRTAPTTGYYREDEQRIIRNSLPSPGGCRVLKLDLWNEVKNTDILSWLSGEGAITHAVDISYRLAHDARAR